MRLQSENSDQAILAELGERIARTRLERNMDQRGLAREAGVSKVTVERLEAGEPVKVTSFVRILRALDLIDRLDQLVPEPLPSPLERLKTSGRQRQRASGRRGNGAGKRKGGPPAGGWSWDDPDDAGGEK
jgi:transcriptional regulator with XRE-family HTH domain